MKPDGIKREDAFGPEQPAQLGGHEPLGHRTLRGARMVEQRPVEALVGEAQSLLQRGFERRCGLRQCVCAALKARLNLAMREGANPA